MDRVEVTLPGGFEAGGSWRRDACVRSLTGKDEEFLLEEGASLSPAALATALLARCLERLGPYAPPAPDAVRSLTVGDREALLLHVRRLTLGDRISAVLTCPQPACGEKMDLDLDVAALLLPPYRAAAAVHETTVAADGLRYRVRYRLPTGGDQEALAQAARAAPDRAAALLVERCVQEVAVEGGAAPEAGAQQDSGALPHAVLAALPGLMAELDPQAEICLDLVCPSCGAGFPALFDTAAYFFRELSGGRNALYEEVHILAWNYHWSEAEIMGLTRRKRRRYLELLAAAGSAGLREGAQA